MGPSPNQSSAGSSAATDTRARLLMRLLRQHGPMSRSQLREMTGIHPNLVGDAVGVLVHERIVTEHNADTHAKAGRPQTLLRLDTQTRRMIGIAIGPRGVSGSTLMMNGETQAGISVHCSVSELIRSPERSLKALSKADALSVGIGCTGFLDLESMAILFSAAAKPGRALSLRGVVDAVTKLFPGATVRVTNDMYALADRYVLQYPSAGVGDTLLVGMGDGQIGATVLHEGSARRGCVLAANEIGHFRAAVKTRRCFCGHVGCIERVFSSAWLAAAGDARKLGAVMTSQVLSETALTCLDHTVQAIASAANFIRPHRVVFAAPYVVAPAFCQAVRERMQHQLLPALRTRVELEWWPMALVQSAENAAWAGLSAWMKGESDV